MGALGGAGRETRTVSCGGHVAERPDPKGAPGAPPSTAPGDPRTLLGKHLRSASGAGAGPSCADPSRNPAASSGPRRGRAGREAEGSGKVTRARGGAGAAWQRGRHGRRGGDPAAGGLGEHPRPGTQAARPSSLAPPQPRPPVPGWAPQASQVPRPRSPPRASQPSPSAYRAPAPPQQFPFLSCDLLFLPSGFSCDTMPRRLFPPRGLLRFPLTLFFCFQTSVS